MRTEDELRSALTALECHAPEAARVLPGRERHSGHWPRPPRAFRWLAVAVTAAALAGAVTALVLPAAPSGPTSDATLRATLLAAFSAASGDIVYASSTALNTGASPIVSESWSYPSRPSAGQLVRTRGLTYNLAGWLHYDDEATWVMTSGELTQLQPPMTTGERIIIDYAGKTWSDQKDTPLPESSEPSESTLLTYYIKTKDWTVRKVTLNGRAALELSWQDNSKGNSWTFHLWVDAATYLPLRETDVFGPPGMITNSTVNYEYLPATPANLAKLTAPIPAGYKRINPGPVTGPGKRLVPSASPSPR